MNSSDVKKLLVRSLDADADPVEVSGILNKSGISYDFSQSFSNKVIDRIFSAGLKVSREVEYTRYLNLAFYRIALTGVAAIVVLLISIFIMEGSISFNSLLGLGDSYDESIVCLLTGN